MARKFPEAQKMTQNATPVPGDAIRVHPCLIILMPPKPDLASNNTIK